ncbi:FAD-binding domain containing protein [Penicillium cosmopolitanum]|uniref:FAD-binding domain containing protein n=1 Tax=Penicillium cosmopolitanum TaxID=1131564 RepID=A0A9W9W862_9EURO|nr:FAD-binding domain containing protein [Penicillium cosmopolitanum]KAJ5408201.1 FAD-binding domain containing protein [Penicillium cosmopolitanum]
MGDEGFANTTDRHEDFCGARSHSITMYLQKLGSTKFSSSKHSSSSMDPVDWAIRKVAGGAKAGDVDNVLERTGWTFTGP